MKKSQLQQSREYARSYFDREGIAEISIRYVDNKTWGLNGQLYLYGSKCWVASGCGYNKENACLREAGHILTGDYNTIFGGSGEVSPSFASKYSLTCNYKGRRESSYTFRRL